MAEGEDWLSKVPSPFASDEEVKIARIERAIKEREFAQLYRVFVDDGRGAQLLAHWEKVLMRRRVPVGASVQEYAAVEAVRDFVQQIRDQIEMSNNQGDIK